MHIRDKLAEAERTRKPIFSFEFFPPKTAQVCFSNVSAVRIPLIFRYQGVQNLYDREFGRFEMVISYPSVS